LTWTRTLPHGDTETTGCAAGRKQPRDTVPVPRATAAPLPIACNSGPRCRLAASSQCASGVPRSPSDCCLGSLWRRSRGSDGLPCRVAPRKAGRARARRFGRCRTVLRFVEATRPGAALQGRGARGRPSSVRRRPRRSGLPAFA
jgi:hypothetical protein